MHLVGFIIKKATVVYDLYSICIQTSILLLCDPKGSLPHVARDMRHIRRCN